MLHRHCKTCRNPLHADDTHAVCVSCLGKSHADSALSRAECLHCECFSLASLRSRIAFFLESDSVPHALTFSSSQGTVRKKQRGRGWKARASHPSKPCRATSALAGCAYSAAGQAASALYGCASGLQGQDACQ